MRAGVDRERGAVMMLTAFISVGALMMVALVVDLGQLRVDRRTNKSVADVAARAGIGRLAFGPWSGVCKAREFLLGNARGFSSFDAGSETWSNANALVYSTNPCPGVVSAPDANPCQPNLPSSWAKLQATAGQGRFTIEIQSGYVLPDPRFPSDATMGDAGATEQGACDNLAVIISERQQPSFAQVGGHGSTVVRTRSVGRLNSAETLDFVAALQLLELRDCGVLKTGGSGTRVIAQPYGPYPGTFQIDSDATGACPGPIIDGQATSGGPSIVACGVNSPNTSCDRGVGSRTSRIGVYAKNFNKPDSVVATPYPSTYGDTAAVASPRTGRKYSDLRYRENVVKLDNDAKAVLTGNSGLPPGCTSASLLLSNTCTGNGLTWRVVQGLECSSLLSGLLVPLVMTNQNVWFNCASFSVSAPLTLSAANSYVVFTGKLAVTSTFTITDPRKVYIGGEAASNKIGLDIGSGGVLKVNMGGVSACSARTGPGHANRLVIGNGRLKAGSGGVVKLCQTFTYLASGYDKVPTSNGTVPCLTTACSTYTGTVDVSSGASVDLSAANEITGRLPQEDELKTTNPFEDIGLWTEAGGGTNGLAGGASTSLTGVFFLPNAKPFTLAGGGTLPIALSAQFVSTTLTVTGNGTVKLVPNPEDSIPVRIYTTLLVR
ncbi:MAG: Tad domain-containing protein [Actinomycetota bacterium]|nr:Tad domain-containing protein [Actinomycetota bacterium]